MNSFSFSSRLLQGLTLLLTTLVTATALGVVFDVLALPLGAATAGLFVLLIALRDYAPPAAELASAPAGIVLEFPQPDRAPRKPDARLAA